MNRFIMLAAALVSLTVSAGALEIPRSVHRVSDLTKASAEAVKGKKGVLWILSDSSLKPT